MSLPVKAANRFWRLTSLKSVKSSWFTISGSYLMIHRMRLTAIGALTPLTFLTQARVRCYNIKWLIEPVQRRWGDGSIRRDYGNTCTPEQVIGELRHHPDVSGERIAEFFRWCVLRPMANSFRPHVSTGDEGKVMISPRHVIIIYWARNNIL